MEAANGRPLRARPPRGACGRCAANARRSGDISARDGAEAVTHGLRLHQSLKSRLLEMLVASERRRHRTLPHHHK